MRTTQVIVILLLLISSGTTTGETPTSPTSPGGAISNQEMAPPPPVRHQYRPKLPMQSALKVAESYIEKEHIDISRYWLYRATWFLRGEEKDENGRQPYWSFWWVNESGTMGDDVVIVVSMDGIASRQPTM